MDHLIEFIDLPGVDRFRPQGLIVVVGPNSSGKTQFLKDLAERHSPAASRVVCSAIGLPTSPNLDLLYSELLDKGLIRIKEQAQTPAGRVGFRGQVVQSETITTYEVLTSWLGTQKALQHSHISTHDIQQRLANANKRGTPAFFGNTEPWSDVFVPLLTTLISVDNRLDLITEAKAFDPLEDIPQNEVQCLHLNSEAQDILNAEIGRTFGKGIGIDSSQANKLILRVSDERSKSTPHFRPSMVSQNRSLAEEGDGLRSYAAICGTILVGHRPLLLIDEPEMCLHPPQAYALGQFIGKHAAATSHTTIVATHSSHILQGITEHGGEVTILRLTRHNKRFLAHRVPNEILRGVTSRPIVRAGHVYDGVFSDAVVVVEADGDRIVYSNAYRELALDRHLDTTFVAVNGLGGIAHTVTFYRTLSMPVAVIADLDIIMRASNELAAAFRSLGATSDVVANLVAMCLDAQRRIKVLPPSLSETDVKIRMDDLTKSISLDGDNDITFVRALKSLANEIDSSRRIKQGMSAFADHPELRAILDSIIIEAESFGLFLVPGGELESWLSAHNSVSKDRKPQWASQADRIIRDSPEQATDVIRFIGGVASFLESRRAAAFVNNPVITSV